MDKGLDKGENRVPRRRLNDGTSVLIIRDMGETN